jgi:thioester reductase-like protein
MEVFGRNHAGPDPITEETVPELPLLASGYAQSKWVAEEILRLARRRGLPVSIYRPNLVFGHSKTGFIEARAAWPILTVRACMALGAMPNDVWPALRLVPVDYVSAAIARVVAQGSAGGACYHLSHSDVLVPDVLTKLLALRGVALAAISYRAWYGRLLDPLTKVDAIDVATLLSILPHPDDAGGIAIPIAIRDDNTREAIGESDPSIPSPAEQLRRSLGYLFSAGEL